MCTEGDSLCERRRVLRLYAYANLNLGCARLLRTTAVVILK